MGLPLSAWALLLVWTPVGGAQEAPQQGLNLRLSFHHGPDNGLDELSVIPRPGLLQCSLYDRRDLRLLTGQQRPKPGGSGLVRESRMCGMAYPRSCVYELEKPMLRMLTHIRASNITDIGHLRTCGHKYGQFPGPCGFHCALRFRLGLFQRLGSSHSCFQA